MEFPRVHNAAQQPMPHMLVHDLLSTKHSLLLCDANVEGFLVRYATQGFVDLFGYSARECLGQKCGDLVGGPKILAEGIDQLREAAAEADLSFEEATSRIKFLTKYAGDEMVKTVRRTEPEDGFALLLNRRQSGELFVCELVAHRHTSAMGWPFLIGVQHDVTEAVPISMLLKAATPEKYAALMASKEENKKAVVSFLLSNDAQSYLDVKARDMWQGALMDMMGDPKALGQQKGKKSLGTRSTASTASRSTASSSRSSKSSSSVGTSSSGSDRSFLSSNMSSCSEDCSLLDVDVPGMLGHPPLAGIIEEEGEEVLDSFCHPELLSLPFPLAIVEPPRESESPRIVGQSACFKGLLGNQLPKEILGQISPLATRGAIAEKAKMACQEFWGASARNEFHERDAEASDMLIGGYPVPWTHQPDGELIVACTCTTTSGYASKSMFYLKQVELDDEFYVVVLADVSFTNETEQQPPHMEYVSSAYYRLDRDMDAVEQTLASLFWYSATMRRQKASCPKFEMNGYGLLPTVMYSLYGNRSEKDLAVGHCVGPKRIPEAIANGPTPNESREEETQAEPTDSFHAVNEAEQPATPSRDAAPKRRWGRKA